MTQIIERQEAKRLGLKRYFTGNPCKQGHIAERLVSDKHCCVCALSKCVPYKREYFRSRYRTDEEFRSNLFKLNKNWKSKTDYKDPHQQDRNIRHKSKADANRAAALLTEMLGIPHVVVETIDPTTGKKTFQPEPKES